MTPLRKIVLYESIQLGATATSSVDIDDPNLHRKSVFAGTTLELNESTGLVTITFRGQKKFVHMSSCRYADALGSGGAGHTVTHYDPKKLADDEPQPYEQQAAEDPDEFNDPPQAPAPKKRGRPPKTKSPGDDA